MSEEQRLWDYLNRAVDARFLDERTAARAWLVWVGLRGAPMPDAGIGGDNQLLYTWDKGAHHFEIELFPDGTTEYFYMNRDTGATWEPT